MKGKSLPLSDSELSLLRLLLKRKSVPFDSLKPHIDSLAKKGFTLRKEGDSAVLVHMDDSAFPYRVLCFPRNESVPTEVASFLELDSTNAYLRSAGSTVQAGTVVFAESQTKGRGKWDRTWFMLPGKALVFSMFLRLLIIQTERTGILTLAAAAAVAEGIKKTAGVECRLKWPNDVLIGNRKVCGILTESLAGEDSRCKIIMGIGINVNYDNSEFPDELRGCATSLKAESGKTVDRYELFNNFISSFVELYRIFAKGDDSVIKERWKSLSGDKAMGEMA